MGIFDWLRRPSPAKIMQREMERIAPTLFPGGHAEIMSAGRKMSAFLDNRIPPESASKIYASARYLAHTSDDKSKQRIASHIERQGMGLIDIDDAEAIYDRFIVDHNELPNKANHTHLATQPKNNKKTTPHIEPDATPIVIEHPENIDILRKRFRAQLSGTQHANLMQSDGAIDGMIAEIIKISHLEKLLGKEGIAWRCGKREYLENSIQSQEILFNDGRQPSILLFDFSHFGGSSEWSS
ncbi:MAG: hypothetical protein I8H88_04960 [Burkholderiales bacterium]|nr:hypothetical protein [Burkholderiales bacterium]